VPDQVVGWAGGGGGGESVQSCAHDGAATESRRARVRLRRRIIGDS